MKKCFKTSQSLRKLIHNSMKCKNKIIYFTYFTMKHFCSNIYSTLCVASFGIYLILNPMLISNVI